MTGKLCTCCPYALSDERAYAEVLAHAEKIGALPYGHSLLGIEWERVRVLIELGSIGFRTYGSRPGVVIPKLAEPRPCNVGGCGTATIARGACESTPPSPSDKELSV